MVRALNTTHWKTISSGGKDAKLTYRQSRGDGNH
jgi:hypothetical protein